MNQRTVRELGGELWAELSYQTQVETQDRISDGISSLKDFNFHAVHAVVDLVMAVLARHVGETIVNDEDLPVKPLPQKSHNDEGR